MMNEHTSLEKYTSHTLFSKGLCVGGELETEQTVTYWPQVPLTIAALFSHSAGLLNRGSLRAISLELVLTASNCNSNSNCKWLQLTQAVCGTWLYNCLTPTCFLWALQLHQIQPVHRSRWYADIFDQMYLFLDWQLGRGPICYSSAFGVGCRDSSLSIHCLLQCRT